MKGWNIKFKKGERMFGMKKIGIKPGQQDLGIFR